MYIIPRIKGREDSQTINPKLGLSLNPTGLVLPYLDTPKHIIFRINLYLM
jgi:hypothetical protein